MKNIWTAGIISFIILLIPIAFYFYYFGSYRISTAPSDWGSLGDYIGGLLGPYIAFLTLLVTIYIAKEISKLEDSRNEKVLQFERKRFLNELRENEFRRITTEIQKIPEVLTQDGAQRNVFIILLQVRYFCIFNTHLFPFLHEKEPTQLISCLTEMRSFLGKSKENIEPAEKEAILKKTIESSFAFTQKMQKFIMHEL